MPINSINLERKLKAIQDKDLDSIIAKNTYIPSLGDKYTKKELEQWLGQRIDFLINARDSTELSLDNEKDALYNSLTAKEKAVADKILSNEKVEYESEEEWEKVVPIILYKFITE